jgi:hypothetical protein
MHVHDAVAPLQERAEVGNLLMERSEIVRYRLIAARGLGIATAIGAEVVAERDVDVEGE